MNENIPIGLISLSTFTDNYVNYVKIILRHAQRKSYKVVNTIMIKAYWLIGCRIVEEEQKGKSRAKYGGRVIEKLSKELNSQPGFEMSVAHLKNCRQFYLTFPIEQIGYTLCSELNWSHLRLIMRLPTEKERNYYINETRTGNWSVRELERNIKTNMFRRVLKNQLDDESVVNRSNATQIKDPYILEFLGIRPEENFSEKKLEFALIQNLEKFILELGKGFSFVERQMHIKTETQDFYIDLVFYNYILKCFVLLDLKKGSLKHQDIGQMDMYVRMFDSIKKRDDDNPTIGIIFCKDKDETIVKYSVLNESKQIFASKYKTFLPDRKSVV